MFTTLIEVDELKQILDEDSTVVFDCRHMLTDPNYGKLKYQEAHIRSSFFASIDNDLSQKATGSNGRHPLPEIDNFIKWLSHNGVDRSTQVVACDDAGGVYGSRLWWLLRWLGHDTVAVLNGGIQAWVNSGERLTSKIDKPRIEKQFVPTINNLHVDASFILNNLNSDEMFILDARANDRFHGKNETIDPIAGHIPGAHNRFFKNNLDNDGYFKPKAQLRDEFMEILGHTSATSVVHQCGSGVSACHNILAMEVAEFKGSKLYPGSWSEWISDSNRPTEV